MTQPIAFGDRPVERRRIGVRARDESVEPAKALRPFECEDRVLDGEHRGRVDRLALEYAFRERAFGHEAEHLRQGPGWRVGLQPLDRARAEDQHAVAALAAEHLLPGEGRDIDLVPRNVVSEDAAGRVGEAQALAVSRDPVAVRHANA